jgi:hypothetical protein
MNWNWKRSLVLGLAMVVLTSMLGCTLLEGSRLDLEDEDRDWVEQWASTASASSEYSSPGWSARQATGAPDTDYCEDRETAWASLEGDGVDWLEVGFETAVYPTRIFIYETHSPGFIVQVDVKDEAGDYHKVWEGLAAPVQECPRALLVDIEEMDRRVVAVRIQLYQRTYGNWNEIDAVRLIGWR